jgi:hypothetical protein
MDGLAPPRLPRVCHANGKDEFSFSLFEEPGLTLHQWVDKLSGNAKHGNLSHNGKLTAVLYAGRFFTVNRKPNSDKGIQALTRAFLEPLPNK